MYLFVAQCLFSYQYTIFLITLELSYYANATPILFYIFNDKPQTEYINIENVKLVLTSIYGAAGYINSKHINDPKLLLQHCESRRP